MNKLFLPMFLALLLTPLAAMRGVGELPSAVGAKIDRRALVTRHNVTLTKVDPANSLQVGNGEFAFGCDVTGLQTFYGNTLSQWG